MPAIHGWFAEQGWVPWAFQEDTWAASREGRSGLLHVPTGAGKTYAAWFGPLSQLEAGAGLQVLWLSPLRAVSRDLELALRRPIDDLRLPFSVASRTGDTSSYNRQKIRNKPPEALLTTPESLCLMLCEPDAAERFSKLHTVIVDEWHELMGSKRGTQVELALARLRRFSPTVRTWALSATLQNLEAAARAAVGVNDTPVVISAPIERPINIVTLVPPKAGILRWAGHQGLRMLPTLLEVLDLQATTLLFTNTRSQAERWYQAIAAALPDVAVAIHHGSIEREERERVEAGLKDGSLKLVVCTSSLDLGVDFGPVEQVVTVGSPKGVARLVQRAGRAAHRPGGTSNAICVPTHSLEIIEFAAVREAIRDHHLEARSPLKAPLDVLTQHMVTCAVGGGFVPDVLFAEVRTTVAYQHLSRERFDDVLVLVRDGGRTLVAYPDYHKIALKDDRYEVRTPAIAQTHRLNIGTIVADSGMVVRMAGVGSLGTIEEYFISRLRKGETFVFAGRLLELVNVKDNVANVRLGRKPTGHTPHWNGSRFPMSVSLSKYLRATLAAAKAGRIEGPEMEAARPLFETQAAISALPGLDELLLEQCETGEGFHLFLYPFEGRLVHEALTALLAVRLSRIRPNTFSVASSDLGLEIVTPTPIDISAFTPDIFGQANLEEDIVASASLSGLDQRQFREVARVAGLVTQGPPGKPKTNRQLQSNASLLYEVFRKWDPDHLLLQETRREVMDKHFEIERLAATLTRMAAAKLVTRQVPSPTPLGLPIIVERMLTAQLLSTESVEERVARMTAGWG